jgi:tRNA nucleotidyltransferase (CCA-adding enzyme)
VSKIEPHFDVPRTVRRVCRRLTEAGESAYVVGGSLRDVLLGRTPGDWDVATTARPERVTELFDKVIPTGIDHGTVTVLTDGQPIEVTTLRGEGAYSDGRHPDRVEYLDDIAEDLARRDFTINAMAFEPATGALHDPFGGRDDLERGVIRAVGDPAARFAEDGLRVLRAARFAAVLGFEVERATRRALAPAAPTLARVSVERKRDELLKTLGAPRPSIGLALMEGAGLLPHLAPELASLRGRPPRLEGPDDAWDHTLARVDATPADGQLRLAALLVDCTAEEDRESRSAEVRSLLAGLRLDRKTQTRVAHLASQLGAGYRAPWTDADVRRFLARVGPDHADDLLALERADLAPLDDRDAALALVDELGKRVDRARAERPALSTRDLAITGTDLIRELGLPPGPRIGEILSDLLEQVLENPDRNRRDRLLDIARAMADKQ